MLPTRIENKLNINRFVFYFITYFRTHWGNLETFLTIDYNSTRLPIKKSAFSFLIDISNLAHQTILLKANT